MIDEVAEPILGFDCLTLHELLVDTSRRCLIHRPSKKKVYETLLKVASISPTTEFTTHLQEFPQLTAADEQAPRKAIEVYHHIEASAPSPPEHMVAAKAEFSRLWQEGRIRPSKNNYASPLHMVAQLTPDKWQACGDYEASQVTYNPPAGFPHETLLHEYSQWSTLAGHSTRSLWPLNILLRLQLACHFELFEYVYMSFGLRNTAQTFQHFIDHILWDFDFITVYIDDILVASSRPEEYHHHLRLLLQHLQEQGFKIRPAKCIFGATAVVFLRHWVSAEGLPPSHRR